jgi:hypothetical protein
MDNDDLDTLLEQTLLLFGCLRESILTVNDRMTVLLLPELDVNGYYKNYYYGNHRVIRLEEGDDLLDSL